MFCKYKTNIAKRKKQSANTLFFITKPSLYLIYLLYLIYIIYLLYHIYLLYPVYPSSRTGGGTIYQNLNLYSTPTTCLLGSLSSSSSCTD